MHTFKGTGVAIVTPFLDNGDIDENGLNSLVEFLIKGKVDYLVVLGTTGENATLDHSEKQKVFSLVHQFNANRIKLVAGIGGNNTKSIISDFSTYNLEGYNAILSVSPYYNKPTQEGIYQHYKALNNATPLPIIMYNVPGRTGMNVSTETTLRIAQDCKNIIATKEASGNMEQIMQIIKDKPDGFEVISGDDGITLPLMACGAIGVISVVANAYPKEFSQMVDFCAEGNYTAARPLHEKMLPIVQSMFAEGSPSGVKYYLSKLGIIKENFRLPVVGVSSNHKARIDQLMNAL